MSKSGLPAERVVPAQETLDAVVSRLGPGSVDVAEVWDEDVCVVGTSRRVGEAGNEGTLAWIRTFEGGSARVSRDPESRPPRPDALARGFDGVAAAVGSALGLGPW